MSTLAKLTLLGQSVGIKYVDWSFSLMPTSERIAATGTEDALQKALLNELAIKIRPTYPLIDLIYHVPNGGSRGGNQKDAMIEGARMKALGTKKGTPDLCLPLPMCGYGALYIEMKKPKDGALSPDQVTRITMLAQANNFCAVIDDWRMGFYLIVAYITGDAAAFNLKYRKNQIAENTCIFDPFGYFPVG